MNKDALKLIITAIFTFALGYAITAFAASSFTTHYNLEKPAAGDTGWADALNSNSDEIDSQMWINQNSIANHITDTVGAHEASAISTIPGSGTCITQITVQDYLDCLDSNFSIIVGGGVMTTNTDQDVTGSKTFNALQIFNSGITASGTLTFSDLTTGILHSNSSGVLSSSLLVNADVDASAAIELSKLEGLTADRALVSDGSGEISASAVTATEIGYVSGVASSIQSQLDGKQASDAELSAIAGLGTDGLIAKTGAGTAATRTITGTANGIGVSNGDGVSGNPTISIAADPVLPGSGATTVPSGTEAERPSSPTNGMFRYNEDDNQFEGYVGGAWGPVGGGSESTTITGDSITTTNVLVQKIAYTGGSPETLTALDFSLLPDGGQLVIVSRSDTNTLIIPVGLTNVSINGEAELYDGSSITLMRDDTQLIEVSRNVF